MARARTGLVVLAFAAACTPPPQPVYWPGLPFFLELAPAAAGDPAEVPVADATFDVDAEHVPGTGLGTVLWDTGSALTTILSKPGPTQEVDGAVLHVYDHLDPPAPTERLRFPPETLMQIQDSMPPWTGVLGGDLLADFTIDVRYCLSATSGCYQPPAIPSVQIELSPYDPTPDNSVSACGAVFHYTLAGGGVFPNPDPSRGDTPYPATRILLDACLDPEPLSALRAEADTGQPTGPTGVDTTLLLDTGSPSLVLASSIAGLLLPSDSGAGGSSATVHLPDGPLPGTTGALDRIALVQRDVFDTPADARGPCMEVYCTRIHELNDAFHGRYQSLLCPDETSFPQGEQAPAADAYVVVGRVAGGGDPANRVPYVRVADEAPILQALRNEVLPSGQRVDGLLGTTLLERLHFEIDYPGGRLIAWCVDPSGTGTTCRVQTGRPQGTSLPCCPAAANPPGVATNQCGAPP